MELAVHRAGAAMPPDYALTDRQRDILARWIGAGAPKGMEARENRLPEITLLAPTEVTTADQTLDVRFRRRSRRPRGAAVRAPPHDTPIADPKACATLMGASSWADGFAWTLPTATTGYFCVRGSVTDAANQTTVVVNPYGMK